MKSLLGVSSIVVAFALIVGCGGAASSLPTTADCLQKVMQEPPPTDPNFFFGRGTATSVDLNYAWDMAEQNARAQIVRATSAKVQSLVKSFTEQVGADNDPEFRQMGLSVSKTVSSEMQHNASIIQQENCATPDGKFMAVVIVRMPVAAANAALVNRIRAQDRLYTRFRASQAFKELEQDAAKYEEFKKQQEQQGGVPPTAPNDEK